MQKLLTSDLLILVCILIVLMPLCLISNPPTETSQALSLVPSELQAVGVPLRSLQPITKVSHDQFQLQDTALKVWQADGTFPNARFVLKNSSFKRNGFHRTSYNSSHILAYSTFLGGENWDSASGVAVDASGVIYVVGMTTSSEFPTTSNVFDTSQNGNYDIFVSKLSSDGTTLEYSTFLGGANYEYASGIVVDASGAVYIVGRTASSNFPTTSNAYDTTYNGGPADCFIFKLSSDGTTLEYSTFLGGANYEYASGIVVDASGAVYIVGRTASSSFPTTPNAYDTSYNGEGDVFISKLSSDGSTLEYSTFLPETNDASGIVVDASGAIYVVGETYSSDFPTTLNAYDTSYNGKYDIFVSKLSPDGSTLEYSTFLGGSREDYVYGITVDASGAVYIAGEIYSSDFPTTPNTFDSSYNDNGDVFVCKLSSDGSTLEYSTFLGGFYTDSASGIVVDASGAVYVVGRTASSSFPTTPNAYDIIYSGNPVNFASKYDIFISRLSPDGSTLEYSTFLGGFYTDSASGIVVDASGAVYVAGGTYSSDFPTTSDAYDTSYNGEGDVFVCRFLRECLSFPSLVFPNGGEVLNGTILVQWTAANDSLGYPVTYALYYSLDGGTSYVELATNVTETNYVWDTSTVAGGENYLLRVVANTAIGLTTAATSTEPFSIQNFFPSTLIFPNGGEAVSGTIFVRWTEANSSLEQAHTYAVSYSADGGAVWNIIALDLTNTTYAWDTTLVPDGSYLLKVVARFADGTSKSDISDDVFTIVNINVTVTQTGTNTGSDPGSTLTVPGWTWLSVLPIVTVVFLWKRFRHRKRIL